MCFYGDCDWYAEVQFDNFAIAGKPIRCGECGRTIDPGQQHRVIELRECECCQVCERADCTCDKPDYGEEFITARCLDCDKFLAAIAAVEIEEGCSRHESQPALEGMFDELYEFEVENIERYLAKAAAMSPELESNGYLAFAREKLLPQD